MNSTMCKCENTSTIHFCVKTFRIFSSVLNPNRKFYACFSLLENSFINIFPEEKITSKFCNFKKYANFKVVVAETRNK